MKYELLTILPLQTEEETKAVVSKLEELLKEQGAMETQSQSLGHGRLAYRVKKTNQGQHWLLKFESDPEKIIVLKQALKLVSGIMRFEIVKASKKIVVTKEAPAPARGWTKREEPAPVAVTEEAPKTPEADKPTLEDLDKRLNAILEGGI